MNRVADLFQGRKFLLRIILVALSGPLFWFFRIRHLKWGDAKIFVEAIPHPEFRLTYNWQAPLDVFLHSKAWEFTNKLWGWDVATVYGVISVLSGVIFLQILLSLAEDTGRNRSEKVFIWSLVATGGFMQLFFGYIESYTIIPTGILAYLWLGIRFLRAQTGLFWPILCLSLTNAFHPSTIVLWPSALILLQSRSWRDRFKFALIPTTIALMVVALMEHGKHGIEALLGVDFPGGADRRWFVPLRQPETEWEHYTMFSWGHLVDIVNEQLLVAPFGLILIALLAKEGFRRVQGEERKILFFLSLASAFYLLFTWTWNPDYGGRKDWDLFACVGIPLNVLAAFMATRVWNREKIKENGFLIVAASFIHTAFWVYFNFSGG
ncbi:MAG: hypothetical protein RMK30_06055 [Anaerolineae bacterium]|nr:hypothetical protein [Anaerolineae bacterium]MDW8102421.1 hypothetical protein [Anaerolineae bacterium]